MIVGVVSILLFSLVSSGEFHSFVIVETLKACLSAEIRFPSDCVASYKELVEIAGCMRQFLILKGEIKNDLRFHQTFLLLLRQTADRGGRALQDPLRQSAGCLPGDGGGDAGDGKLSAASPSRHPRRSRLRPDPDQRGWTAEDLSAPETFPQGSRALLRCCLSTRRPAARPWVRTGGAPRSCRAVSFASALVQLLWWKG